MKKLFGISFLLALMCFAAPVFADEGDMPTGTRTCTQNCGLYNGTTSNPAEPGNDDQNDSAIDDIYSWINEQILGLIG